MKTRSLLAAAILLFAAPIIAAPLEERCGPLNGNHKCSNNRCCSQAGYCGIGPDFCNVPWKCLKDYGHCDSDIQPPGKPTAGDKRPKIGTVPFGVPITQCTEPGSIALTYDDGPSEYTAELLEILKKADAKATFFVSGIMSGRGEIDLEDQWIQDIRRMEADGHQVGSHGWSHFNLDTLPSDQRRDEMYKNERAIANILGKYPTYMRAPYIRCEKECLKDMSDLGYKVIQWSVDSRDTEFPDDLPAIKKSVNVGFAQAGDTGGILLIQHDTLGKSAIELTAYVLDKVKVKGWKPVTVAECLGESLEVAYRKKEPVKGPVSGPAA